MFGFLKKKKKKKEAPQKVEKAPEENVKEDTDEKNTLKKRNAAMHVTKHKDGGWQVKKGGAQRALKRFKTQKEAIEYAKAIEKEKGTGYIIHKASGSTRKKKY